VTSARQGPESDSFAIERTVLSFPMDALDPNDPQAALRRGKKESSHTTFFKAGTCLGRTLLCIVKASALSSTIKTLEPIDQNVRAKNKPTFRKLLQGGNEMLKVFKVRDSLCSTVWRLYHSRLHFYLFIIFPRSSTFRQSPARSTSSRRSSALDVRKASRSWTWRRWTRKDCWIRRMRHWTLCRRRRTRGRSRSIGSRTISCCVMMVSGPVTLNVRRERD